MIGDAQIELGMYDEAAQTMQTMVDQRPDLSSYARYRTVRDFMGMLKGQSRRCSAAVDAGGANAENTNWVRVQLGDLYFNRGQLEQAEQQYTEALANYPGYNHALAALGRVSAAKEDYATAIDLYLKAIQVIPLPQYVIGLGRPLYCRRKTCGCQTHVPPGSV